MKPNLALGVLISQLSARKKVIPIVYKNGELWHSDIKMPDIKVENNSGKAIQLKQIEIMGYIGNEKKVNYTQGEKKIAEVISETAQILNRFLNSVNPWHCYNLHMLFGDVPPLDKEFSKEMTLQPGEVVCLRLQELFHFHFAGEEKVEQVTCELSFLSDGGMSTQRFPIPLLPYHCKGDYVFPLRGNVTVIGMPLNGTMGHRVANSQEFAFDVVDFRRDENGEYNPSSPANSARVEDYYLFERKVHAIGDGVVVAAGNQWPNQWAEYPLNYSEDRIVKLTVQLLEDGMDFNHAILGNYVIIDHLNGEFSLYAHMSEGTVTVAIGDHVTQGQVIGKVGNTSNSDFPHLHFHLMDSPDFQTANGLPMIFRDFPRETFPGTPFPHAPLFDYQHANSLIYSDYLFAYLPELGE